jgi:hypothetical protein
VVLCKLSRQIEGAKWGLSGGGESERTVQATAKLPAPELCKRRRLGLECGGPRRNCTGVVAIFRLQSRAFGYVTPERSQEALGS